MSWFAASEVKTTTSAIDHSTYIMPHPVAAASSAQRSTTANQTSNSKSTAAVVSNAGAGSTTHQQQQDDDVHHGRGCLICGTNDNEGQTLLCEHCDGEYHTYCLQLDGIPEGEWYCGKWLDCVEFFGFLAFWQNILTCFKSSTQKSVNRITLRLLKTVSTYKWLHCHHR